MLVADSEVPSTASHPHPPCHSLPPQGSTYLGGHYSQLLSPSRSRPRPSPLVPRSSLVARADASLPLRVPGAVPVLGPPTHPPSRRSNDRSDLASHPAIFPVETAGHCTGWIIPYPYRLVAPCKLCLPRDLPGAPGLLSYSAERSRRA